MVLAHDERSVHFQKTEGKKGHTAIGASYVDRIHRKLYHTRYAVDTRDHDFITYFEFDRKHTDDFKRLLDSACATPSRTRNGNTSIGSTRSG